MSGLAAPVNVSWTPPAFSDWHFTNNTETCEAASKWTGAYVSAISIYEQDGTHPVPMNYSVEYLRKILPPDLQEQPDDSQLAMWYYVSHETDSDSQDYVEFWSTFATFSLTDCSTHICSKIGWEEDPDIAGVGMLVSYYIVAGLATFYYFVLLGPDPSGESKPQDKNRAIAVANGSKRLTRAWTGGIIVKSKSLWEKVAEPFWKTSHTFLLANLIFTVGMLGAALWRFYSASRNTTAPYTIFNQLASLFMSCFSLLSCLALQTVVKPKIKDADRRAHDRHLYRWSLALPWLVTVPMTIALFVLYLQLYPRLTGGQPINDGMEDLIARDSLFAEYVWLNLCDPYTTRKKLEIVLYAGLGMSTVNALWFSAALVYRILRWTNTNMRETVGSEPKRSIPEWARDALEKLRLLDGFGCIVLMWAFLVMFHMYRDEAHDVALDSDGGSKAWSFGQILALAAWAPTLLELCNGIILPVLLHIIHKDSRKIYFALSEPPMIMELTIPT